MAKVDGSIFTGSRTLTIGSADGGTGGKVYVAENFGVDRKSTTIESRTEANAPRAQSIQDDFVTGSATIQLDSSEKEPVIGDEFTTNVDATIGAEIFILDSVSRSEAQGAEKKLNITFRKQVTA